MVKWDRRQFLSGLTAAGVQIATPLVGAAARRVRAAAPDTPAPAPPAPPTPARPAPAPPAVLPDGALHGLEAILPPGQRFGRWRIAAVHAVKLGAVPLVLETRHGERFQVDILRRDGATPARRGIAETRHYALYLANVGRGTTPTPEEHGLGVMWLAALLRKRERRVAPPALLTLRDRLGRFPDGRFNSLAAATPPAPAPVAPPAGRGA